MSTTIGLIFPKQATKPAKETKEVKETVPKQATKTVKK